MAEFEKGIAIIGGSSNIPLAEDITAELQKMSLEQGLGVAVMSQFPGKEFDCGEVGVTLDDTVRGTDIYVVGSHGRFRRKVERYKEFVEVERDAHYAAFEQKLILSTARSSGGKRVTALTAYMGWGRQDRRTDREPIAARMMIEELGHAGAQGIIAVDMHSAQAEGYTLNSWTPFEHVTATPIWRDMIMQRYGDTEIVIASPDAGSNKPVERLRDSLELAGHTGVSLAYIDKKRNAKDNGTKITTFMGDVKGRVCFLLDDIIDGGGTITTPAYAFDKAGAREIIALATHPVLSYKAPERLRDAPINEICVTDTLPIMPEDLAVIGSKLHVVSVAPFLARVIMALHTDGSVQAAHDGVKQRI